jgi:hypothetical protein
MGGYRKPLPLQRLMFGLSLQSPAVPHPQVMQTGR